jgi:hypothetical protein
MVQYFFLEGDLDSASARFGQWTIDHGGRELFPQPVDLFIIVQAPYPGFISFLPLMPCITQLRM